MAEGNDQQQQNGAQGNGSQNGAQGNQQQGMPAGFDPDKFRTALMEDFKSFAQSNQQGQGQQGQQDNGSNNGPSNQDVLTAINAAPEKIVNGIREAFGTPGQGQGQQQQQDNSGSGQQDNGGSGQQQEPGKKTFAQRWFS